MKFNSAEGLWCEEPPDDGVYRWDGGVMLVCAQRLSEAGTSRPDPVPAQLPVAQRGSQTGQTP